MREVPPTFGLGVVVLLAVVIGTNFVHVNLDADSSLGYLLIWFTLGVVSVGSLMACLSKNEVDWGTLCVALLFFSVCGFFINGHYVELGAWL